MGPLDYAIIIALLLAAGFAAFAVYSLALLPASRIRRVTIILLVLTTASNILFITLCPAAPGWYLLPAGVLTHVIQIWGLAVSLRLLISISKWTDSASRPVWLALKYIPAIFLTVIVLGGATETPSAVSVTWSSGLPDIDYGYMAPVFYVSGMLYVFLAIGVILLMLLQRPAKTSWELLLLLLTSALGVIALALWAVGYAGPSSSAMFLLLSSFLGVIISFAVISKSPLIVPQKEDVPKKPSKKEEEKKKGVELGAGGMYLFVGGARELAKETFIRYVMEGWQGLWVTRRSPGVLRKASGLVKTPFIWLTSAQVEGEVCVNPRELGQVSRAFTTFIDAAKEFIILLEGMEYILSNSNFQDTLRLVHFLNDKTMSRGGILIVSVDPAVFSTSEFAKLRTEAAGVFGETGTSDGN